MLLLYHKFCPIQCFSHSRYAMLVVSPYFFTCEKVYVKVDNMKEKICNVSTHQLSQLLCAINGKNNNFLVFCLLVLQYHSVVLFQPVLLQKPIRSLFHCSSKHYELVHTAFSSRAFQWYPAYGRKWLVV